MFSPGVCWRIFVPTYEGDDLGQVLHGSAATTHAVRAAIQQSKTSIAELNRTYGVNPKTIAKWKKRERVDETLDEATGWATRQVARNHRTFGQFAVPSLRQLTKTAPYMHDGSLATLEDVAEHYSDIDLDRIHSDGAQVLRPLKLSEQEKADLVAFLRTLSSEVGDP